MFGRSAAAASAGVRRMRGMKIDFMIEEESVARGQLNARAKANCEYWVLSTWY
jgi:hypothetical protein